MLKKLITSWTNVNKVLTLKPFTYDLIIYSENSLISSQLLPLIKLLDKSLGNKLLVIYSAFNDINKFKELVSADSLFVGDGSARTYLFPRLETKLLVTSTPSLETLQLKKSSSTKYAYINHSPVSTHMVYEEDAFDNFDYILCTGPNHLKEINERENIYNLPPKKLIKSGYLKFDDFNLLKKHKSPTKLNTVLIAPSWGPTSITSNCINPIIKSLLNINISVIFRPHYMTKKREVGAIVSKYIDSNNFLLDISPDSSNSLLQSDLIISEWSGIILDAYLGYKLPVIFIDLPPKANNSNYKIISNEPIEISMRNTIGEIINPPFFENINQDIFEKIANKSLKKVSLAEDFADKNFYNFGSAGQNIADQIATILSSLEI